MLLISSSDGSVSIYKKSFFLISHFIFYSFPSLVLLNPIQLKDENPSSWKKQLQHILAVVMLFHGRRLFHLWVFLHRSMYLFLYNLHYSLFSLPELNPKRFASCGDDGRVCIWKFNGSLWEGENMLTPPSSTQTPAPIMDVEWAPSIGMPGMKIACAIEQSQQVVVWSAFHQGLSKFDCQVIQLDRKPYKVCLSFRIFSLLSYSLIYLFLLPL